MLVQASRGCSAIIAKHAALCVRGDHSHSTQGHKSYVHRTVCDLLRHDLRTSTGAISLRRIHTIIR